MSVMQTSPDPVPSSQIGDLQQIHNLEAASELDNFIYIVSHDLRNSARALTEVPQWLRDDLAEQGVSLNEDAQENFELLERHAKRLDRMLLDLLVYSRIGRLQEIREFDLNDLVARVIEEKDLPENISVQVDAPLPMMTLGYNDAFMLVKCIVDNVVTHSPSKGAQLSIRGLRKRNQVTLTFTDNGRGMRDGELQRAFRPMTTLRRRDEVEGSGMGLAIVQRIVQYYRGELWAGNNPDGTGFRLRIRFRDMVSD